MKTILGFLNAYHVRQTQSLFFGVDDHQIVHGYLVTGKEMDEIGIMVHNIMSTISPRHDFYPSVQWIPVLRSDDGQLRHVLKISVLNLAKKQEVFAEVGKKNNTFLRVGAATWRLTRD